MSESESHWYERPSELQRVRKQLGVTQTELSERSRVKQSLISAIETGKRPISNRSGEKLWRALGDISYEKKRGVNALRDALLPSTRTLPGALDVLKTFQLDKSPEQLLKEENQILKDHIQRLTDPRPLAERLADLEARMNAAGPVASEEWKRMFTEARPLFHEEDLQKCITELKEQNALLREWLTAEEQAALAHEKAGELREKASRTNE